MKKLILVSLFCIGSMLRAADSAPVEFSGLLVTGSEKRFSLVTKDGTASAWVGVGQEFKGWKVIRYVDTESALVLRQGATEAKVFLNAGAVGAASVKATIDDANEVFEKMRFDDMLTKVLDQQKAGMAKMMKQMAGQQKLSPEDEEAFAAFQTKVAETMMGELKVEEMRADMAGLYADAFTKQQLQDLSAFYSTSTGQALIDKQPEMQAKMQEIMMPRIMRAMPKVQALGQQFQSEMAARKKAAAAETPAPAPVTPKD